MKIQGQARYMSITEGIKDQAKKLRRGSLAVRLAMISWVSESASQEVSTLMAITTLVSVRRKQSPPTTLSNQYASKKRVELKLIITVIFL